MAINNFQTIIPRMARRLLNQMGARQDKVFAVGFNKSGTSSLHALFQSLGRPSYHGEKWRTCNDLRLLNSYDCFSDGIPDNLSKLDRLFAGSKFILQVRDLESWVYSRLAHIERHKKANIYKENPKWDTTEYAIKTWIQQRNAHHLFVLSYFSKRPSDLLIVNFIRDEDAAIKICQFLGYEGTFPKPKININLKKQRPQNHIKMLRNAITDLNIPEQELAYDIYCPSLENKETHSQFPPDCSQLNILKTEN